MTRGSDRIDEERVCIDALVQNLKRLVPNSSVEAEKEADDPPDYWLTLGKQRFAVEVTSIVADQGYDALCEMFCKSVENQLESDSPINGKYLVNFFRRPDIPRRGTREWKVLVANALAKIGDLASSAPASKVKLHHDRNGHISISKWSSEGSAVRKCWTPEAKREVEAQGELAQLMDQAISKKLKKLQKKALCQNVLRLFCFFTTPMGMVPLKPPHEHSLKFKDTNGFILSSGRLRFRIGQTSYILRVRVGLAVFSSVGMKNGGNEPDGWLRHNLKLSGWLQPHEALDRPSRFPQPPQPCQSPRNPSAPLPPHPEILLRTTP